MYYFQLFETLMKTKPEVLKKIVAIEGDMTIPNLGIHEDEMKQLISEVNIVFHMAASLRLEAGL